MRKKLALGSGLLTVAATLAVATPAFAWHPQGSIQKFVTDQTTNSSQVKAEDNSSALAVNSGDTLAYTIVVSNDGAPASNGDDDMATTVMTDQLPTGVELVSNPATRTVTANLGTIKPGDKVTTTVVVKVTSTDNGSYIVNKACFTGNSIVNDNPQSGCDTAVVKVSVPTPTPTPTPTPPQVLGTSTTTPSATSLPNTGPGDVLAVGVATALAGYTGLILTKSFSKGKL
jgi:uncharacterized repeat protein (TIGR01451 family)